MVSTNLKKKYTEVLRNMLWEHWTVDIFILQLLHSVILMQFDALSYLVSYLFFNTVKETK